MALLLRDGLAYGEVHRSCCETQEIASMANTGSDNTNRPDLMDSLTETQLSELENQFDENDRDQFNTLAGSYGWDMETCQRVWDWLSSGRRHEGFQGKQPWDPKT
jgi:hypothetical protein